jgi:putative transposase
MRAAVPSQRPPRIPGFSYLGRRRYHVVLNAHRRAAHFESDDVVELLLATLRGCAADCQFDVLAYCVMPDHVHLVLEGLADDSSLVKCVESFKQRTGFAFRQNRQERLWQHGWFDHVLRSDESTLEVCRYVIANPLRAGLATSPSDYAHVGSFRFSMEELSTATEKRGRPAG